MRYILIVDDEPLITGLLSHTLTSDTCVIETATDAQGARKVLERFDPDVAIIDLHLGTGPSGFDLAHYVNLNHPETYILAISRYSAPQLIPGTGRTLPEGTGFLAKEDIDSPQTILEAIDNGISGHQTTAALSRPTALQALTAAQLQVLRMMAQGYNAQEISNKRGTKLVTTEQAVTQIYARLGITSRDSIHARTEAVRIYIQQAGLPNRNDDE